MKKLRDKTSVIWTTDIEKFKEIILNSKTMTEILSHFNMRNIGNNYLTVRARVNHEKLDISHLNKEKRKIGGNLIATPLEQILVENSTYNTLNLKNRLVKNNILTYICADCGIGPEWCGEPLSLQLDHINGVSNDNRIENLRILCPNCHSQSETFSGKQGRVK